MIEILIDTPSDAEQRIDKFTRKYLPNAPLGGIFKWLRTGKIKVNHKKVDQTYRIVLGDCISLYFSPKEMEVFQKKETRSNDLFITGKPPQILFEDDYLLIVNKSPGLNVHPGDHKSEEPSLIEKIQDYLGKKYNTLSFKPSLVHRIDRDTSGCIIIAKEKKSLEILLSDLQLGKIKKIYHAIIIGNPKEKKGTIDAKLLRIENAKNEAKVRVDPSGQQAITHYHVKTLGIQERYSLIECEIETGRTHQIRVHLASLGHPILGDRSYGDVRENSYARREYGIHRQLLHAESLVFTHPITKKTTTIVAPYFPDMKNLLSKEK